ncbi:MAG: hypothetical protein ACK59Y_10975 [Betaproteobacteria bacterium]|nr:hypothetical protein [Betaproteobacteria bacterium]
MALAELGGLFALPRLRAVDLQYGNTREERSALKAAGGPCIAHINGLDATRELDRLTALIEACDIVFFVSNTTAHLAGALGKPAWVLLPHTTGRFCTGRPHAKIRCGIRSCTCCASSGPATGAAWCSGCVTRSRRGCRPGKEHRQEKMRWPRQPPGHRAGCEGSRFPKKPPPSSKTGARKK